MPPDNHQDRETREFFAAIDLDKNERKNDDGQ